MLFRLFIIHILFFPILLLASQRADENARLPIVLSHSELKFDLASSQKTKLTLKTEDSDKVIWMSRQAQICTGSTCDIDSRNLGVGRHVIAAIALNQFGSKTVLFTITVKNKDVPLGESKYIPKIQQFAKTDQLASSSIDGNFERDAFIVAEKGSGLVSLVDYNAPENSRIDIIRQVPRVISWEEKVQAKSSNLKFGYNGQEEFYLLRGGRAKLIRADSVKKVVILELGSLRYRDLSNKSQYSTIMIGDWGQVDVSPYSDIIVDVAKGSSLARVHVLQGQVYLRKKHPFYKPDPFGELSEQEKDYEKLVLSQKKETFEKVTAGHSILIPKDQAKKSIKTSLVQPFVSRLIKQTTPNVLNLKSSKNIAQMQRPSYQANISMISSDLFSKSRTELKSFMAEGFYVAIIEAMLIAKTKQKLGLEEKVMLAEALEQISAGSKVAYQLWLEIAKSEPENQGLGNFRTGLYHANYGKLNLAQPWLEEAESREFDSDGLGHYYLGQIYQDQGKCRLAMYHFKKAYKSNTFSEIKQSSLEWKDFARHCIDSVIRVSGSVRYVQNIFRVERKSQLINSEEDSEQKLINNATGYTSSFLIEKYFFNDSIISPFFHYKIERDGWFDETIKFYDYIYQNMNLGLRLGTAQSVSLHTIVQTHIYNNDRALDGIGGALKLSSGSLPLKPYLEAKIISFRDPSLGISKIMDPISSDYLNSISDLSSRLNFTSLGVTIVDNFFWNSNISIDYQARSFTNSLTRSSDFNGGSINLNQLFPDFGGASWNLDLSFTQLNYGKMKPALIEKRWDVAVGSKIELNSMLAINALAEFEKQVSDRVNRSFDSHNVNLSLELKW